MNWKEIKARFLKRPEWRKGRIGWANRDGGIFVGDDGRGVEPYGRADIADGCVVYTNCPVWRHRDTGQIVTRDPIEFPPQPREQRTGDEVH